MIKKTTVPIIVRKAITKIVENLVYIFISDSNTIITIKLKEAYVLNAL